MSAAAMQLKGCPTICDEDLRRVEVNESLFCMMKNIFVL